MELQEADPGSQEHSDGFGEQGELRVPRVQQQSPVLGWDEAVMGEWHAELGSRVQSQQFSTVIPDVLVAPEVWDFPFFGLCRAATDPSQCLRVVRGCSWDPWWLVWPLGCGCFHHPSHGKRIPSHQQPVLVGMLLESSTSTAASPPPSPLRVTGLGIGCSSWEGLSG